MEFLGPSLSLVIAFVFMSIVPDVNIATPAFFVYFHFHEIPFPISLPSVCVCLLFSSESLVAAREAQTDGPKEPPTLTPWPVINMEGALLSCRSDRVGSA